MTHARPIPDPTSSTAGPSAAATPDRGTVVVASIAAGLGVASAAVSAYWAVGGTALLDTVGGEIERWGRQRAGTVVLALWVITGAKLSVAAAPLAFTIRRTGRPARIIGWFVAVGLTLYGAVLTGAGLLVEAGLIDAAPDADRHALAWHTYFWDPWFALWGLTFTITMWRTRDVRRRRVLNASR